MAKATKTTEQTPYTAETIDAMETKDKPSFILEADWDGELDPDKEGGKPKWFKFCPSCKARVSGLATPVCPNCKKAIPKKGVAKPARGKPAPAAETKKEVSYPTRLTTGKQIIGTLGAEATKVLESIKDMGSIDEAIAAVSAWKEFEKVSGSKADATLAFLKKAIDGETTEAK